VKDICCSVRVLFNKVALVCHPCSEKTNMLWNINFIPMGCILLRGVHVNDVNNICSTCTRNCCISYYTLLTTCFGLYGPSSSEYLTGYRCRWHRLRSSTPVTVQVLTWWWPIETETCCEKSIIRNTTVASAGRTYIVYIIYIWNIRLFS
jgi:hypothetical protein